MNQNEQKNGFCEPKKTACKAENNLINEQKKGFDEPEKTACMAISDGQNSNTGSNSQKKPRHINVSLFVPHLGCPHTCIFCNQRTISGTSENITSEAIIKACSVASAGEHCKNNSEIAFFGGSFTAIDRETMLMCLNAAEPFLKDDFGGIRISTRPDCIDDEVLSLLKQKGVTSIELGAQSMINDVLIKNERGHTPQHTVNACKKIKEYGFSLGLQMMTGLYGSSAENDIYTAGEFIKLKPDTVRIYPTVVLEGTALCKLYANGSYTPPTLNEQILLCAKLLNMFNGAGIKVIRMGLHSGGNVEQGYVAGVYHPAFRELCEAEIYKNKIEAILLDYKKGSYEINVNPTEISKVTGQKKSNILYFYNKGYKLTVKGKSQLKAYDFTVNALM